MSGDWKGDLKKSTKAFCNTVWPELLQMLGDDCRLEHVEAITNESSLANELDIHGGIDFCITCKPYNQPRAAYGFATRVQFGSQNWETFTIRHERGSGALTEWEKRKLAYTSKCQACMCPGMTVQAYVDNYDEESGIGDLIGMAVIVTADLIREAMEFEPFTTDKRNGAYLRTNPADSVTFVAVSWDYLKKQNAHMKIWVPQ